nr:LRBL [Danio rerio]
MDYLRVCLALVLMNCGLLMAFPSPYDHTVITCLDSDLHLRCDYGVIFVKSSRFGWRSTRTCGPARSRFEVDPDRCYPEISLVPEWCNGRAECMINKERIARPHHCFHTHYITTHFCVPAKTIKVCERDREILRCEHGRIKILAANYGRTDDTTCLRRRPYWRPLNTNCYSPNTLDLVSKRCEGRKHCSVFASNDVFSDPCVGTRKYLEITYTCRSHHHD